MINSNPNNIPDEKTIEKYKSKMMELYLKAKKDSPKKTTPYKPITHNRNNNKNGGANKKTNPTKP